MKLTKLTASERRKLEELVKKAEQEGADRAEFLKECRKQKEAVLKELKAVPQEELDKVKAENIALAEKLQKLEGRILAVCQQYGCTVDELFNHISSDRQANYYYNLHKNNSFQQH